LRKIFRTQSGFSFIEVLVAMLLAAILGLAVPGALSTANKTTVVSNQLTLVESLGRSQMDYIQRQSYDRLNNPPVYNSISGIPAGYSIVTQTVLLDPKGDGAASDDDLQKITVDVKHGEEIVYTLVDYKVDVSP
jgi:prepilin-type N-terminal cleavage/methylation domain-containing protein